MQNYSSKQKTPLSSIIFMWSILLVAYLLNYFHSLSIGVLQPYLITEFQIDAFTVTNIGSMYFYLYVIMQIPTGLLVDKFGVRIVSCVGTFLAALGTYCFATTTDVFFLYLGRALIGIGTSVIFVCIIKFQVTWMKANIMVTMTGLACFLGTLGGVLAQSPLVYLVEMIGWRASLYLIAAVSLINAVFMLVFIKSSQENCIENKEEISIFKGLLTVVSNVYTWPSFFLYAAFYGSYVLIMGYIGTSWLVNIHGVTTAEASSYIILGVLGSAIASVIIGFWSDKIGNKKKPMLYTGFAYIITWALFIWFGNTVSLFFIACLLFCIGFFSCAFVVCWSCVQEINPKKYSGIAVSVVNIGGFVGPIILPYVFLVVQNGFENAISIEAYQSSFIWIFVIVVAGYLCSLFVKEPSK